MLFNIVNIETTKQEKMDECELECKINKVDEAFCEIDFDRYNEENISRHKGVLIENISIEKPVSKLNELFLRNSVTEYSNIAGFDVWLHENRNTYLILFEMDFDSNVFIAMNKDYICLDEMMPLEDVLEFLRTL